MKKSERRNAGVCIADDAGRSCKHRIWTPLLFQRFIRLLTFTSLQMSYDISFPQDILLPLLLLPLLNPLGHHCVCLPSSNPPNPSPTYLRYAKHHLTYQASYSQPKILL